MKLSKEAIRRRYASINRLYRNRPLLKAQKIKQLLEEIKLANGETKL